MATDRVDVIDLIDRHPVSGFQISVLILCMLVAALDGFDTQAIGYTAPAIAHQINLPMPQFGQVASLPAASSDSVTPLMQFGQISRIVAPTSVIRVLGTPPEECLADPSP